MGQNKRRGYVLKWTRSGWQMYRRNKKQSSSTSGTGPTDTQGRKRFVLISYNVGKNTRTLIVRPEVASSPPNISVPLRVPRQDSVSDDLRYPVRCLKCNWHADEVRRLERTKGRHSAK